jgi:hypothetical protein
VLRVQADFASVVGAPPEGATHWGLQRKRPGTGADDRKGWSTLAFPPDSSGVCRHEVGLPDLTMATIREASEGAGGGYRIRWMGEAEDGSLRQISFGRTFTLAPEEAEPAPVAVSARPRPAMPAPPAMGGGGDLLSFMVQLLAGDREAARAAQERADRDAREAREEQRRREDREREEARRRDERDREDRQRSHELERERLRADMEARNKSADALASIARAIEAQSARLEALEARVEEAEDEDDDDDAPAGDGWQKVAEDLAPIAKKGAEALVNALGGAAE